MTEKAIQTGNFIIITVYFCALTYNFCFDSQVHQTCRSQSLNCSFGENALFTLPPVSVLSSSGSLVWNVSIQVETR